MTFEDLLKVADSDHERLFQEGFVDFFGEGIEFCYVFLYESEEVLCVHVCAAGYFHLGLTGMNVHDFHDFLKEKVLIIVINTSRK